MSYLERLKANFPEKALPKVVPKVLKDPSVSFGTDQGEPVSEIEAPQGDATVRHPDLSGVSPEFTARLSAEDVNDIAAGDIPVKTVQVFEAAAIAREAEDLEKFFEERAGILEYDAGLPRPEAEVEAMRITATYARNRRYAWASLREALSGYPGLSAQVPDRAGTVRTVHVREGAKPGPVSGSVVRPRSRPRARALP